MPNPRTCLHPATMSPLALAASLLAATPAAAQASDTCSSLVSGIVVCTDATGTINSVSTLAPGPGLVVNSANDIVLNIVGNVTTTQDGEAAVLLRALDEVIFNADGILRTTGDDADGADIEGSTVAADLNIVRTEGEDSDGVEIVALNGPISLDAELIETEGDLSQGTILRGTGDVSLQARAIRTGGTDAVAIDISTDAAACILLGVGGCDVTAAVDEVTTEGFGGIGALVAATGDTDIDIGLLRTGGDEAAGLDLSADPAVCVVLGAGACDTAFTLSELTTAGDRSPGALVRAVGDIDADVGLLRTQGDEAVGLDLASDPQACAILGAGACDTSFAVGQLTTSGAGATGILVRAAGDTNGNVGVLRTQGADAIGIDIASNPQACAIIGAGACDVGLVAQEVSTQGPNAGAVVIRAVGDVAADLGLVRTDGANSGGLDIAVDPVLCLALGPGSCAVQAQVDDTDTDGDNSPGIVVDGGEDPVTVDAGTVDTDGDNSPGVDVEGTGPITVDADSVDTSGDNSAGIVVDGDDDPVSVTCGTIVTRGANSPGVAITAEGRIDVQCNAIATAGPNSDGVQIDGGVGPVDVDVGSVVTAGTDSDGIDIATATGAQTIAAGPITVTGIGADGISAVATGCGNISITARDDIRSDRGAGISASSACAVTVTTLAGAPVSGGTAGIDVTSGTGTTIILADNVSASNGPAIDADGAAAAITVQASGSITGRIDLTGNNDVLSNNGLFAPAGTSDFGAGADLITNAGTIRVNGTPTIAGLESTVNLGLIGMVDNTVDDRLTLSGNFTGGAGSQLAIDVASAAAGTPADRLIVGGNAGGATAVTLNLLGGGPSVANASGTVIVDAASSGSGAFTLAGPTRSGLVDYSLRSNGTGDTLLVALPNELALEPIMLGRFGQDFWYQSADAWSASAAPRRHALGSDAGRGFSFWAQGYGSEDRQSDERTFDVFGTARDVTLRLETNRRGAQTGFDFRAGSLVIGVTGGYQHAAAEFASGAGSDAEGHNIGAYLLFGGESGLYGELLAKADFFDMRLTGGSLYAGAEFEGKSYGVEGEIGYRGTSGSVYFDLNAALAYVRTSLDPFETSGFDFAFDSARSVRGRLGLRVGGRGDAAPYADFKALHEFRGDNEAVFESGGFSLPLADEGRGTWFRGEAGLEGGRNGSFVAAWAEFGDVRGYGVRLGLRF